MLCIWWQQVSHSDAHQLIPSKDPLTILGSNGEAKVVFEFPLQAAIYDSKVNLHVVSAFYF